MFFQSFSKNRKTALGHAFHVPQEAQKPPMDPSGGPRSTPGMQLGRPERSKDPHLEAQRSPKTSTGRLETRPRRELGGSKRSQTLTLGSQAPQGAQLGIPKPLQTPNLDVQLGGTKLLQNLTFEKSEASGNQTPRIRATRSKSIDI